MTENSGSDNQTYSKDLSPGLILRVLAAIALAVLVYWLLLSQGERNAARKNSHHRQCFLNAGFCKYGTAKLST